MYEFPDVEKALQELSLSVMDDVVLWAPADLHDRAPIAHIQALPSTGQVEDFMRTNRVQIDVYATGRTASRDYANDVRAALVGPHGTAYGLLDDVYVEQEPHEQPYPHDTLTVYSATYRVDTRLAYFPDPIPAP